MNNVNGQFYNHLSLPDGISSNSVFEVLVRNPTAQVKLSYPHPEERLRAFNSLVGPDFVDYRKSPARLLNMSNAPTGAECLLDMEESEATIKVLNFNSLLTQLPKNNKPHVSLF